MSKLPKFNDPMLLVGTQTCDDAAVYRISPETAIIQTVDFFTPVVDDPYTFGQIAAANALSDVYAMGGEPKLALNIAAFPSCLSPDILGEIMAGGADKIIEAGAVLAGGHTIMDDEPKYGLSVTGFVHPDKIWKNDGAREGDILILTKPLGTGIINTAVKRGGAAVEWERAAVEAMSFLNKYAADKMKDLRVHGCTDITGFGLAGHGMEMAQSSGVTLVIHTDALPVLDGALECAAGGFVPGGACRNREYAPAAYRKNLAGTPVEDILYDPQTSGGLLLAVHPDDAEEAMKRLAELMFPGTVIGHAKKRQEDALVFE